MDQLLNVNLKKEIEWEGSKQNEKVTVNWQESGRAAVAVIISQVNSNYQKDRGSKCRTQTQALSTQHSYFLIGLAVFFSLASFISPFKYAPATEAMSA